jgi:glycosyltransferase involved in cell wall biosynthesis
LDKIENKKINFSVAIITYNEETNIKECIESVHEFCKEIVILDSLSTDKTVSIAKSFSNVRVYSQKFKGHIEQKNDAISLCDNDWILSLDADERATPRLMNSIRQVLENPSDCNGYKISRLTFHMGRFIFHSGWYPLYRYRFFKKGFAKWIGENPHDYIEIEGKGKKLKGDIIHYSFKDLSQQVDTINKFSSIVAFTRYKKGISFSVMRSIFKPFTKFLEIYVFKLGFLDGYPGFAIAVSSAYSTFLKTAKIYELKNKTLERPSNLRPDYGNEA